MKRVYRASRPSSELCATARPTTLAAGAASVVVFALLAPARGADEPRLSVQGQEIIRLAEQPQNGRVYDLVFSPRRGSLVCAFALEKGVQVWELSAKPRAVSTLKPVVPINMSPDYATFGAHALAFSSDGARLALGYFGMQVWDVDQRRALYIVPLAWFPEAVKFSAMDNTLVIGCSYQGFLNAAGRLPEKIEVLRRNEYERMSVTDPKHLVSDSNVLLHGRTGARPREEGDIFCLTIYPDGKRFVAGGGPVFTNVARDYPRESSVTVWDIATGRRLFEIGSKELPILRFCLSPDGRTLYSCGDTVRAWDAMNSVPPIQKFDASARRMVSVAVSPDGTILAAGDLEGTVIIWRVDSTQRLATLKHEAGPVYGLAFSQASRKLVAAGERGVVTVWDLEHVPRKRQN
jgi:WD40 repeat protein